MGKKNTALIFGITPDYDFALANVLFGLKEHSPGFADDIIVYHTGLTEQQQQDINTIRHCLFRFYQFPMDKIRKEDVSAGFHKFSQVALCRYEIFDLLEQYKKVVWLDVDILIKKDISDILIYSDETGFAISQSEEFTLNLFNFNAPISGYDMYHILYNSGTLVIGEQLKDHQKMTAWCYETTIKYAAKLANPDQAVLNLLIQHFHIPITLIDTAKYVAHPISIFAKDASIVHSWGDEKFWNSENLQQLYPKWIENNKLWEAISQRNEFAFPVPVANTNLSPVDSPKVTVLMPVYNGEQHLAEAIDSILHQSFSDFEFLIIVEHGTNKASLKILESYSDPRIVFHNNEYRLGLSDSLNLGLKLAKGEYVVRMDADDISLPDRLKIQVDFMDANPKIGVAGGWLQYFNSYGDLNIEQTPSNPEEYACRNLFNCSLAHSSAILRKKIFWDNDLQYKTEWHLEDHELWARMLNQKICKITNIPVLLIKYRLADDSKTARNRLFALKQYRELMARQVRETLGLEMTHEEISLCDEMLTPWGHMSFSERSRCSKVLYDLFDRMLKANKQHRNFDQQALKKTLNEKAAKVSIMRNTPIQATKQILKRMAAPLARPIMRRLVEEVRRVFTVEMDIRLKNNLEQINANVENNIIRMENAIHRHMDFVQRDTLIVLQEKFKFIPDHSLELITDHPVAVMSADHQVPHGTVRDNTRHPRFIRKCETLFSPDRNLSFMDLGCSGGGIVLDAVLRGHFAIGIEGSDHSLIQQRAEWRLLKKNLFTCDITKKFLVRDKVTGHPKQFDIISFWEVIEHLPEADLPQFFDNLKQHLNSDGYLVFSVSCIDDIDPISGTNWHVTVKPKSWWVEQFEIHGFNVHEGLFHHDDCARGGSNPPLCYEQPYIDIPPVDVCFTMACSLKR
jgi:glycosyltransferase involved in cell wall biosynthesis/2-polyprenyl-3-methyl-5-hydroxy-6-metoxy-1,4-benzoquinol methylase